MKLNETDLILLLLLIIIVAFIYIVYFYFNKWIPFINERKYIKDEMLRTSGNEYKYWKNKLKRLYVRSIPFIGYFLCKFIK